MPFLKKSLGQHFLRDENVARKIVRALPVRPGTQVLEIGPGGGALTRWLAEVPDIRLRAVEIDERKALALEERFGTLKGAIISGDILSLEPPFEGAFSVIGNFPYNISSQILLRLLGWKNQVDVVVAMFQKEVAERIVASPRRKAYGILSVLVQAFYDTEYLFEVSPTCFEPPPKVDSAVIRLVRNADPYGVRDERRFYRLVKTSFGQRRKILRNPVRGLFDNSVLQEAVFARRAEELSVREFADLSNRMR